jgi:hypothetical protein
MEKNKKHKKLTTRISVSLTKQEYQILYKQSAEQDRSISWIIRKAINGTIKSK